MIPERLPPPGFGVRLSRRTEVRDGGAMLTGRSGSVLFLSAPAREVVARLPLVLTGDPTEARVARELLDRGLAEPCWPTTVSFQGVVTHCVLHRVSIAPNA